MEKDAFAIWKDSQPRILRGTIWDRALLEEVPPRFRMLYTVFIPLNHLFLALFAVLDEREILIGVPLPLVQATSHLYGVIWTVAVCILALASLIGLIIRTEHFELYSTVILVVVTATYQISELILIAHGNVTHASAAAGVALFLFIPIFRVIDLFAVILRRRAARA